MDFERAKFELNMQEDIRDKKALISGRTSKDVDDLLDKGIESVNKLRETPEGEENERAILETAKELGITEEEIKEAFETGLKHNFKAGYKEGFIEKKYSEEELKSLIGAFALSFRSSLKLFLREKTKGHEETSKNIIKIIERIHLLPPHIIKQLREKYKDNPNVDDGMIKRCAVGNPRDSEKAIEKAIEQIKQLREKYKDNPNVDDGMIKIFALGNPRDSEKAIEKALKFRVK